MQERAKKKGRCFICKKEFVGSPFYPFCSERCQMIDLGAWLDEKYVIPEDAKEKPLDEDSA